MRILLLGGTGEARRLAEALAKRPDIEATLSFAGRTEIAPDQPLRFRVGGFGGIEGLRAYLRSERISRIVDATHPFAAQMSRNAHAACRAEGLPLARLSRPPWEPVPGDRWIRVASLLEAAAALGSAPRRVFLTVGRTELSAFETAPQHYYLVRSIGAPDELRLPLARLLLDRPPFDEASERELMQREGIEILVTKNSGGPATAAKLAAARALGIPVVMVDRPEERPDVPGFGDMPAVLDWLDQAERGV